MRIYIKPMTKRKRSEIYKDLNERQKWDVKHRVFLTEYDYPKPRGRNPKYDFLYVWVSDIDEATADKIEDLLHEKTGRRVFHYPRVWTDRDGTQEQGYAFLLPWRSPEDGKALPYKLRYFNEIKTAIEELVKGSTFPLYGKVQESEQGEKVPIEDIPKEEEMEEKEDIRERLNELKAQRDELKKKLESVERIGRFAPGYLSKKKKLKKEIEELDIKIRQLELKM